MKVAVLCVYPSNKIVAGSGAERYNYDLTHSISHIKDIELHVISVGKENKEFKEDNLIIHMIQKRNFISIPIFHPLLVWKIIYKTTEIDPDIVHATSTSPTNAPAAAFLRDKYPTMLTVFGITAKEQKYYREDHKIIRKLIDYTLSPIGILIERYVLSKMPNIVVQTPSIKNIISKWTKSKIYIVPSGIDYERIKIMQSNTLFNEKPDIFIVNYMTKIKGIDFLIKALPIVTNSIPNLSVCIGGSGPQENELKYLVKKLGLDKTVKFLGFVSEEEKYQYYKSCKIVVVPSRWDCQPDAPLVAAASGKPAIASRIGGIQDTVEDGKTGFLFEPENIEDLADKIVTLLKDEKLREEIGSAAKEKVKSYDWKKIAERTVEIYNVVIADFHERKAKTKRKKEIL